MTVSLQLATDGDLPAIVALMNAAFRGERGWSTEANYIAGDRASEAMLRGEVASGTLYLVAPDEATGELAGCVSLTALRPEVWYLGALSVRPAAQNAGFGRGLLAAAEEYARARGARRMVMTVLHVREELLAWYERRGYRRTGKRRAFPYGDDRFGRPLRDDLEFVVLQRELG